MKIFSARKNPEKSREIFFERAPRENFNEGKTSGHPARSEKSAVAGVTPEAGAWIRRIP
ncbi:MAG TPA: hypothetical protein VGD97_08435 [Lacunisphaera sp.]